MNATLKTLTLTALVLIALTAFADNHFQVVVNPSTVVYASGSGPRSTTVAGLCSSTPCNVTAVVLQSASTVSTYTINGPVVQVTAGSTAGETYVIMSDGNGHTHVTTITTVGQ